MQSSSQNHNKTNRTGNSSSKEIKHSAFGVDHRKNPESRITGGKPTGTPPKERK